MLSDAGRKERDAQIAKGGDEGEREKEPSEKASGQISPGDAARASEGQIRGGQKQQSDNEERIEFPVERARNRRSATVWNKPDHRRSQS
jgi:hypothetical protein